MNYYYFFVILHPYLGIQLYNSLEPDDQLLDFQNNINNPLNQCSTFITYNQVAALLARKTCPSVRNSKQIKIIHHRKSRQIDSGNLDIKAIQTTVNDHLSMIQYLFNNSINQTILVQELYKQAQKPPSLTSWRDWVDILCISTFFIILIYALACRPGFSLCDRLFIFLFRPVLDRIQQQQLQQQSPQPPQAPLSPQQLQQLQQSQLQPQQLQQQQQTKPPQQIHQYQIKYPPTSILPTAPPPTTYQQLKSISAIADTISK